MSDEDLLVKPSADLQRLWAAELKALSRPLTSEELKGFGKQKFSVPNLRPFIKFDDLNNKTAHDIADCNPKRPSVCVGLEVVF